MPADPSKIGRDHDRIALAQVDGMQHWCVTLGCTEELLREAVMAVGRSADEVRLYLAGRQPQHESSTLTASTKSNPSSSGLIDRQSVLVQPRDKPVTAPGSLWRRAAGANRATSQRTFLS